MRLRSSLFHVSRLVLLGGLAGVLAGQVALAAEPKPKCADMTQGRLMGLEYTTCRLVAMTSRMKFDYQGLNGFDPSETNQCKGELLALGEKAYKDTYSCLVKTKQKRAAETLDDYYASWRSYVEFWTNLSAPSRTYEALMVLKDQELNEMRTRLAVQIK